MRNIIVGYTIRKQKNYSWLAIVAVLIICAVLTVWAIMSETKPKEKGLKIVPEIPRVEQIKPEPQKKPEEKGKREKQAGAVTVLKRMICRKIVGNLPVEQAEVFYPGMRVYYYNRINMENVPQRIKHIWFFPDGNRYEIIELYISHQPADTWSYMVLPPDGYGKWKVQLISGEKILDESTFMVKE